jgi:CTP:molybdopterin cytidylyltransferase MocA
VSTGGVAAVLLAAGAARRLGAVKPLLPDEHGTPLAARLARAAVEAGCRPVLVVTGSAGDAVEATVRESLGAGAARLTFVRNAAWADGVATSIGAGVQAAGAAGGVVLLAVDQPAVSADHLRALLAAHARHGGRVVSSYDGVHGIPAVWPRADFAALCALTGDRGARGLLRGDEEAIPLAGGALDLDTPEDVRRWRAATAAGSGAR